VFGRIVRGRLATERADLEPLFHDAASAGLAREDELEIVTGVMAFAHRTVREAMTPRTAIVAAPEGAPTAELARLLTTSGYTRLPLYRDSLDEIVGMVRPFVNEEENAVQGVRRGWCENISTRATWRGKGVASSLICLALRALRDRGMTEAALGVDAQNETGALRLYESMGFREVTREVEWRRPLGEVPGAAAPATDGSGDATLEARA